MAKLEISTAPTAEPVSVMDARRFLSIEHDHDNMLLRELLVSAREDVEKYTFSKLITQTWKQYFDAFADPLVLRLPPFSSVTSVTYIDDDGDTQTLSTDIYEVGDENGIGVIRRKYDQDWPTDVRDHEDVIIVTFVVGYGDPEDVPQRIKQAIMMLAGHHFRDREGEGGLPPGYYACLEPYSYRRLAAIA